MTYSQYIENINQSQNDDEAIKWYFNAEEDKDITDDEFAEIQYYVELKTQKEVI